MTTTTTYLHVLLQPALARLTYSIGSVTYVPCPACGASVAVGAGHLCPMARRMWEKVERKELGQ